VLVPGIKQLTQTSCPWDLQEFGGVARYVQHWRLGVRDGGGGHCFPSGHAASAFALLSGWFVLRGAYPRAARLWLGVVVLAGIVFGTAQLMRGAHYPSHTLWTAWFCWVICTLLAHWLPAAGPRGAASAPARP
jgi:membrane-associated PAP2 superfamily phosphatase